jgi:transglutaminase-like putative cysteine protease
MAYWMALAVFLYRASQGSEEWLPVWALNLLGIVYLPVVYLDFTRFVGSQVLRPLLHLACFALVVKLFALGRERDKWHLLIGTFFLFLASMGTSVHPSAVLYLVAFLALSIVTLTRFATYHYLATFARPATAIEGAPLRRFLLSSVGLTVLLGIALFPLLPRLGNPYIVAGAGGGGQQLPSSGFSDRMSLDGIGRIRTNNAVAMRLEYETPPPVGHQVRYKGATYDVFEGSEWRRSQSVPDRLRRNEFGVFELSAEAPRSWVGVWVQPLGVRSLFVPVSAVAIEARLSRLTLDEGGAVFATLGSPAGLEYRVALAERAVSAALEPGDDSRALDSGGITPRIAALAARAAGGGDEAERARRLERFLVTEYAYTLELLGRSGESPIEEFLFENRRGHCELFASAMVLMLRSQGIAARLVTGFLGGEASALEGYFIVRQSNAHAWVEAYIPGRGWQVYEPTPPAGRPSGGGDSPWLRALQAYDYLIFRWDRYILTFGAADQVGLLGITRDLWEKMESWLFGESPDAAIDPGAARAEGGEVGPAPETRQGIGGMRLVWGSLILMALVVTWWSFRHRSEFDATRAYRLLRRRARRRGLDLPPSMGPEAVAASLKRAWPAAAPLVDPIVWLYLEESFGGRRLAPEELTRLRATLREASSSMKRAA